MTHYIAMSGDHGCLPDHCEVYPTVTGAENDLIGLFELGAKRARVVRVDQYLELNPRRDGASYCEIQVCDCPEPWVHQDGMSQTEFIREYGDYGLTTTE
jgi:hypothetical protein